MALDIGHKAFEREVRRARVEGRPTADGGHRRRGSVGTRHRHPAGAVRCPDFTVLEQSDGVGGTWRDNTYPGAACDVPSHLYSFSFAPKTDWSRRFAEQPEILDYAEDLVERFRLGPHLQLGTTVTVGPLRRGRRPVASTTPVDGTGEHGIVADTVVFACGQLNRPHVPDVEGLDRFAGPSWHSARWDHSVDLAGRRVAVVGTGASAIQFVPPVAAAASSTTVFQRSPNYVGPKKDRAYPVAARQALRRIGPLRTGYRWWIYWTLELRWVAFRRDGWAGRKLQRPVPQGDPRRRRQRPAPRARGGARLPRRLQTDPDLQRLVPRPAPARRHGGRLARRPRRARRRGHGRRHASPRRRPDLRHRVRHHGLPLPHPRHRDRVAGRWPTPGPTGPTPTSARRSPASPTATSSTDPTPTSATTPSCSWWSGSSTSSCRRSPSRPGPTTGPAGAAVSVREQAYHRDDRRTQRLMASHRVGGQLHQLVQVRLRPGHQQLAVVDGPLLVGHPPAAATATSRSPPAGGAPAVGLSPGPRPRGLLPAATNRRGSPSNLVTHDLLRSRGPRGSFRSRTRTGLGSAGSPTFDESGLRALGDEVAQAVGSRRRQAGRRHRRRLVGPRRRRRAGRAGRGRDGGLRLVPQRRDPPDRRQGPDRRPDQRGRRRHREHPARRLDRPLRPHRPERRLRAVHPGGERRQQRRGDDPPPRPVQATAVHPVDPP